VFKKLLISLLFLSAPVMAKETLTIYTYSSFASEWGPGPAIKQSFEQQCDCTINFVSLGDGVVILNRLRMEGKNSKADIVLGLDNNLLTSAEQTGLFAKHSISTANLNILNGWQNDYFLPYDYGYFAFIYNKEKIANPPTSMQELLDSKNNWKVVYQDPRTSTPGLGLLLWMKTLYGDNVTEAWQKLATKTLTVTKGWSDAYGLFLKGEADLVLSYTTSPAYHIIDEKDERYAAAMFSEGHYRQIEIVGQLASSKQPELAAKFMAFVLTPDFQNNIATKNWMYPVTDVALPDAFNQLAKPEHILELNAVDINQNQTHWIQEWQRAVSQ